MCAWLFHWEKPLERELRPLTKSENALSLFSRLPARLLGEQTKRLPEFSLHARHTPPMLKLVGSSGGGLLPRPRLVQRGRSSVCALHSAHFIATPSIGESGTRARPGRDPEHSTVYPGLRPGWDCDHIRTSRIYSIWLARPGEAIQIERFSVQGEQLWQVQAYWK